MPTLFYVDQVSELLYWIKERHQIYLRRKNSKKPPWSNDETMQQVYFTNPYRENDKVTVWFRDFMRGPRARTNEVLFATIAFRRFNSIQTGEVLLAHNLHLEWDTDIAYHYIKAMTEKTGLPYLSAAYMITGEKGKEKLGYLCDLNSDVYEHRKELIRELSNPKCNTLQAGHKILTGLRGFGPFTAYELITDLRHTKFFWDAKDINTWCSFGPGAKRGLNRLLTREPATTMPPNALDHMNALRRILNKRLPKSMPQLEMREVEHSLCEFDKYMRVKQGGRPKRWYPSKSSYTPEGWSPTPRN